MYSFVGWSVVHLPYMSTLALVHMVVGVGGVIWYGWLREGSTVITWEYVIVCVCHPQVHRVKVCTTYIGCPVCLSYSECAVR